MHVSGTVLWPCGSCLGPREARMMAQKWFCVRCGLRREAGECGDAGLWVTVLSAEAAR